MCLFWCRVEFWTIISSISLTSWLRGIYISSIWSNGLPSLSSRFRNWRIRVFRHWEVLCFKSIDLKFLFWLCTLIDRDPIPSLFAFCTPFTLWISTIRHLLIEWLILYSNLIWFTSIIFHIFTPFLNCDTFLTSLPSHGSGVTLLLVVESTCSYIWALWSLSLLIWSLTSSIIIALICRDRISVVMWWLVN